MNLVSPSNVKSPPQQSVICSGWKTKRDTEEMVHLHSSGSPLIHTPVTACDLSEFKFNRKEGKRKGIFLTRLHLCLVLVLSTSVGCTTAGPFLSSSMILTCNLSSNSFNNDIYSLCLVAQSCPPLCNPWTVACQAPLSMGILQARILEWVAMPSSRRSSQPRDRTKVSCLAGRFFATRVTWEAQEYWSGRLLFI